VWPGKTYGLLKRAGTHLVSITSLLASLRGIPKLVETPTCIHFHAGQASRIALVLTWHRIHIVGLLYGCNASHVRGRPIGYLGGLDYSRWLWSAGLLLSIMKLQILYLQSRID